MKNTIMESIKNILGENSLGWREISKLLDNEKMKRFKITVYIHGGLERIEITANSKEEAIGKLLIEHFTTCYDHVKKVEEITE